MSFNKIRKSFLSLNDSNVLQELCTERYNDLNTQIDIEWIRYIRKKRILYSIVLLASSMSFFLNNDSIDLIEIEDEFEQLTFESNYDMNIFSSCEVFDLVTIIKQEFDCDEVERIFDSEEYTSKILINDELFGIKLELKFELNNKSKSSNYFDNFERIIRILS